MLEYLIEPLKEFRRIIKENNMTLKDNPTAQEAANYFAETPQHEIRRHKIHIKSLEEVLSMTRKSRDELKAINADLLEALDAILNATLFSKDEALAIEMAEQAIEKAKPKGK